MRIIMEINEREELYSNYIRQMEKIELMKECCQKNIENIYECDNEFNNIDNEVLRILEDIRINNRDDEEFIKNIDMITSDLNNAKYEVQMNINNKYDELVEQERDIAYMEEQCTADYKNQLFALENSDESNEGSVV